MAKLLVARCEWLAYVDGLHIERPPLGTSVGILSLPLMSSRRRRLPRSKLGKATRAVTHRGAELSSFKRRGRSPKKWVARAPRNGRASRV